MLQTNIKKYSMMNIHFFDYYDQKVSSTVLVLICIPYSKSTFLKHLTNIFPNQVFQLGQPFIYHRRDKNVRQILWNIFF